MSGFSPEWLAARESIDAASRSSRLTRLLRDRVGSVRTIEIVDLGAGTGANLRYLAPLLGGQQDWRLVDDDPRMLDAMSAAMQNWAEGAGSKFTAIPGGFVVEQEAFRCRGRCLALDLATDLAKLPLPESALLTGSALLDLVSEKWLRRVAARCLDARATVLFALTYDGRMRFDPEDSGDQIVRALVNRHQLTDKGFGPAMGPAASSAAESIFEELGYRVRTARSDWRIGAAENPSIYGALLDGWLEAAVELERGSAEALSTWHRRRKLALDTSKSELVVGHQDLLAYLPDDRGKKGSEPFLRRP